MLSITLKQLELFVTAVETKSFSKAASELAFSQSVISANISSLEEILGAELFDRTNKKNLIVTEAGQSFYKKAKDILSSCYTFQDTMNTDTDPNVISIGADNNNARYLLADVITKYRESHPSVRILLKEGSDKELYSFIENKELHLGIIADAITSSQTVVLPFYFDKLVLALPNLARYQVLVKTNKPLEEILRTQPFVWNQQMDEPCRKFLEQHGLSKSDLNITAEVTSEQFAKNAVIDGWGISLLSKVSLKCSLKSQELLMMESDLSPSRALDICYNPKIRLTESELDFIDLLRSGKIDFDKCIH